MPVDADILLSVGLVAVYLIDSMHFLSIGEALVTTRGRGPFGVSFGTSFELAGRRVFVANPFTPCWPEFRVEWDTQGAPVSAPADVTQSVGRTLQAMRWMGPLAVACAVLIALIAPVALALGFQLVFVLAAALCLLLSIAACLIVILRRSDLGLSAGQVASTVFVAIVCLPCAPNVLRSIARRHRWRLNARDLVELGFESSRQPRVRERVRQALMNAQRFVSDEGKERAVIDAQLRALGEPAP